MTIKRILPAVTLGAAMILSGCVTTPAVNVSSRNAGLDLGPVIDVSTQNWDFARLVVLVPESLEGSEANTIKPRADIVWREDPVGDRHAQVQAVLQAALEPALAPMQGATPVTVQIEVTRFHALTERARYTIGGEHEIEFTVTVAHAETGQILSGPREVDLTFRAYGGQQAVDAEAQGITQRVRITQRLQQWVHTEFPQTLVGALGS
ncbi:hypothetical protein KUV65_05245 [Maritalea mobilis]|uniref:DUF6778 family protein n=1 Tax=Maritalea mobilis TaxID=483324 RepID=UPI001C9407E7|nr:DUF6778 family protein [Maritalea mobilis]MBY6200758.1 hypothetical protein [Maritalea mobilis]